MLKFIYGSSGCGKTAFSHKILAQLCEKENKKLMMLVPDQSSFVTETAFLDLLGPKLCRNILVFGFSRLSNYVFTNTGNLKENVIDDGIRNILMSMTIDRLQDVLTFFNPQNKKSSIVNLMVHSLKECKKDNISPDLLVEVSKSVGEETLKSKLKETALVLETYDVLISNTYIDPLDNLNRLAEILQESAMFDGYTIVVDSFSGFTYQQLEIIKILMRQSKDFYVTVNLDLERRDFDFFATTNRTAKQLKRIAVNEGIDIDKNIILDQFFRSDKEDIKFLEKNIFGIEDKTFTEKAENIETYVASDIYNESQYIANKIKKLVIEDNYKYSDIAIVTRDNKKYSGILDVILKKNNIPFFMDVPKNIYVSPVVRFVLNAIDSVINGFERDTILSMLKTGLVNISQSEIADFENYLFIWQINHKELKSQFKNNPFGFESRKDTDLDKLEQIECTRKKVIEPLVKFCDKTTNATGLEISKAIYELMIDFEIPNSIKKLCSVLEQQGLIFESNEMVRVYNMLVNTLDKLVAVISDKKISLATYRDYLNFKIADLEISDIPHYQDQVSVGTADRIRLASVKAVFVIGTIEGEFPSIPKTAGIFSENERRLLIQNNVPLTDSLEELACHEKYLAYCVMTSCSEKLFVTCYLSDYSSNSFSPSVIFSEIEKMFPNRNSFTRADINEFNELWSEQQAFECLAKNYKENVGEITALKNYFSDKEAYNHLMDSINSYLENEPFKIKNKQTAQNLFKKYMHLSASQIEKFNLCAFQYFCNYGLKAKERRVASIDEMQFGNIVHYFLEQFLKSNSKEALNQLSDKQLRESIDEILKNYADENLGGLEEKTKSFLNLFNRLKKNIFTLIKEIIRQLEYSDFVPSDFELKIGENSNIPAYKIQLENGCSVSVNGFVDRVDLLDKSDDEVYVRIVDYKTGNKIFKLSEIMYGINLQMLIYLRAIVNNGEKYYGKKLIPAGILYMPSFTNEISADKSVTEEYLTKELDKNFKMNGLILNDSEVINRMDRNGNFIKLPRKIQEGIFSENLATKEQFEHIFSHIDQTVKSMCEQLLNGEVTAKPAKGEINGCQYCPYDSICCRRVGDSYKYTDKLSPKKVYEKMGMEV